MMTTTSIGSKTISFDASAPVDLSIPMSFSDHDPNLYDVPAASTEAFQGQGFIGDTRQGGTCNFDSLTITPHCNGTHTECIGHVTHQRVSLNRVLQPGLLPCILISILPESLKAAGESSRPALDANHVGITARQLETKLSGIRPAFRTAVIIRTLPNALGKQTRQYANKNWPFFSIEAIQLLLKLDVQHILTDLPSLDRLDDDGEMAAHRTWWDLKPGAHSGQSLEATKRTITEMIFVPETSPDGLGLLSIQTPAFESDAAPSRPLFFPVIG